MMSRLPLLLLVCFAPALASADPTRIVDHARLKVGDVVADAPREVADVDLGPAPPPGASRVVARDEVLGRVRDAGYETAGLRVPPALRLVGAARRIRQAELDELCTTEVLKVLPRGVSLVKTEAAREVVVPPRATVREVRLPRLPRQRGPFHTTATLEFQSDGEVVVRAPIPVTLDISEQGAQPDVPRGRHVTLVIDKRGIRVSTPAVCQADANFGDVVPLQVAATGRVLRARINSADEAEVIDIP